MKFFDPRIRIIMESVQPINREYVRVTGKLVTLTRSPKFRSSKLLEATYLSRNTQIIFIFNTICTSDTDIHFIYRTTTFHDSFSFKKYFYVRMNFNFEIRISS